MPEASIIILFELQSLLKILCSLKWISRLPDAPMGNMMLMHELQTLTLKMKIKIESDTTGRLTYRKNLSKEVYGFAKCIEPRIVVPSEKGHDENQSILVVRGLECAENRYTFIPRIGGQWLSREECADIGFVWMQRLGYFLQCNRCTILDTNCVDDLSMLTAGFRSVRTSRWLSDSPLGSTNPHER